MTHPQVGDAEEETSEEEANEQVRGDQVQQQGEAAATDLGVEPEQVGAQDEAAKKT